MSEVQLASKDTADEVTIEVDRPTFDKFFNMIPAQARFARLTLLEPNLIINFIFGTIYLVCRDKEK